jgi:hypothetical protein
MRILARGLIGLVLLGILAVTADQMFPPPLKVTVANMTDRPIVGGRLRVAEQTYDLGPLGPRAARVFELKGWHGPESDFGVAARFYSGKIEDDSVGYIGGNSWFDSSAYRIEIKDAVIEAHVLS